MCEKDIAKVREVLEENLGEMKLLDEWMMILNNELPSNRRFTKREIAYLFSVFNRKGYFQIEKTNFPIQYCFSA